MKRPPRKLIGTVVSTAMDKTAVVAVDRLYVHDMYRKIVKHRKKYFVHDHHQLCGVGDVIQLKYCGQVSKKKFWTVVDVLKRQPRLEGEPFEMSKLADSPFKY
jgi:small subunit ribosomal protein S17